MIMIVAYFIVFPVFLKADLLSDLLSLFKSLLNFLTFKTLHITNFHFTEKYFSLKLLNLCTQF